MKRSLLLFAFDLIFFFIAPYCLTNGQPWSCGKSITVNHIAGSVAPVTKTVTYGTVTNVQGEPSKCWITQNLGADHHATTVYDTTEASAGWYWQFGRKQGYKHDGTTRTPNTTWINPIEENTNWNFTNDPCIIELGNGWRIPTYNEWKNVIKANGWKTWNGPWKSRLGLHAAGQISIITDDLTGRGRSGTYWSRSQDLNNDYGEALTFRDSYCGTGSAPKASGISVRCIQDEMFNTPNGPRK